MWRAAGKVLNGIFLFIITLPIASSPVFSEETEKQVHMLEEICVTATRLEKQTLNVPASVAIADEEEIENTRMFNIKEVLEGMPGVLIESPNQGYDSRLIIRGSGLKARYGVRDIMVLMDGVPITDPDSFTRMDFIDTQLIKQIEVVKGPNSTLWGANAAGGVINILTKSPFEQEGGVAKFGVGEFGSSNGHFSFSANTGDILYYTVSGSRRKTDNDWRRWNEFDTTQGSVKASLIFEDGSTLENYFGYTDASIQLPGKLDQDMFKKYLKTGEAKETEGPWQYSGRYSEIFFFHSRWTKEIGNFELQPVFFINYWNHLHPVTGKINHADTNTYGMDIQANYSHKLADRPGTLTFGVTGRFDDQETDYYEYAQFNTGFRGQITEVLSDARGKHIETQDRKTELYGIYVQESFQPTDRCFMDLGLRYDEVKFDITGSRSEIFDYSAGTYIPASDPVDIDKSFSNFSPRLGISCKLINGLNIYTQFSRGTQTPTEGELSENPELDAVKIYNYEIGLKARHPRWSLDTALYFSPVENEVVQVIGTGGDTQYVNSGKTKKKGFEFSCSWFATPSLKVRGAYSYTDYIFDDFSEPVNVGGTVINLNRNDNTLPYVPENQFSLSGFYRHPSGLRFRIETLYWGSYYMDNANSEKYEGYEFIINTMIAYEFESFDISLNAYNLFDEYYAIQVQKDTRGVIRYTPAASRSLMLRLTCKF